MPAHAIAPAPTGVAAFVGRAARGPVNHPVALATFAEFQRLFGGLHVDCAMAYAVRDFFLNGGRAAIVLRLAHADARAATITLPCSGHRPESLVLQARNVGGWGSGLSAAVRHESGRAAAPAAATPSARRTQRFDLHLRWQPRQGDAVEEVFAGASTAPGDASYLPELLERASALVRVRGRMPGARPASTVPAGEGPAGLRWLAADAASGSDGGALEAADLLGDAEAGTGLHALARAEAMFDLLCIPPPTRDANTLPSAYVPVPAEVLDAALALCVRRHAMLLVDPDPHWGSSAGRAVARAIDGSTALRAAGAPARNAALYFPCLRQSDPLREDRIDTFVPGGAVAGVIARTDAAHGVWTAPAGTAARLAGVQALQVELGDSEAAQLQRAGLNGLRALDGGEHVVWGARTLRGGEDLADEFRHLPVRRMALFLARSIEPGTAWAAFEPNGPALWAQLRLSVGNFLLGLFRQGAFQGVSAEEAFFVRCGLDTMTQDDIAQGRVVVLVGFAPLRPAEFVILRFGVQAQAQAQERDA